MTAPLQTNRELYRYLSTTLVLSFFLFWQVNDRHDECCRFESTWVSAVRLCETAAEAAYTSGGQYIMSHEYGPDLYGCVIECLGCHGCVVKAGFLRALVVRNERVKLWIIFSAFVQYCLCLFPFCCCQCFTLDSVWIICCHSAKHCVKQKGSDGQKYLFHEHT